MITEYEAALELQARRRARSRLIDFATYTYPGYTADPMHELIAAKLDAVAAGEITRLIISTPPQHGKSLLASVLFPAYWLGRRPNDPVILASYAADLAHSKSRESRAIVEGHEYRALFGNLGPREIIPVQTSIDSRAVNEWRLSNPHRGGMRAVGVGGGLTGFPGMLGIIDDPISSWRDAQSHTIRETAREWYRSVFRTRIWEGGAIVIIMTRWHRDDLAGWLLDTQAGQWELLRLPALAETQVQRDRNDAYLNQATGNPDPLGRAPGEPVAPRRFSRTALEGIRTDIGSLMWSSLYDGVPRAAEGNRIKRQWFSTFVDAVPSHATRIRYWDKADNTGDGAATAGVLLAQADGLTYVEDVQRGFWSAFERERIIRQTAELDAQRYGGVEAVTIWLEQEPGSGGKESADNTIRNLSGFVVHKERPTGDKDTRLEPFAAQLEAGNVRLKRGMWNADYIEEFVSIPNGVYRDQSDATAGAFNKFYTPDDSFYALDYTGLYER
ncbi:MAG: phage terminase large subunit [Anaerolineae bacterium]|nr:phage terminase large subunit [Anaerolineae bacterium]